MNRNPFWLILNFNWNDSACKITYIIYILIYSKNFYRRISRITEAWNYKRDISSCCRSWFDDDRCIAKSWRCYFSSRSLNETIISIIACTRSLRRRFIQRDAKNSKKKKKEKIKKKISHRNSRYFANIWYSRWQYSWRQRRKLNVVRD